ncbi:MAG: HPr-rel-A system PqqD family peptide chaperone [Halioglobus sp.]
MKWQIHSVGRFYDANESTVVYFDSHSGDTHLITDFAAFLLQQFNDQPLSAEELINRVSPKIDSSDTTELNDAVLAVVNELVSLDILKRE